MVQEIPLLLYPGKWLTAKNGLLLLMTKVRLRDDVFVYSGKGHILTLPILIPCLINDLLNYLSPLTNWNKMSVDQNLKFLSSSHGLTPKAKQT